MTSSSICDNAKLVADFEVVTSRLFTPSSTTIHLGLLPSSRDRPSCTRDARLRQAGCLNMAMPLWGTAPSGIRSSPTLPSRPPPEPAAKSQKSRSSTCSTQRPRPGFRLGRSGRAWLCGETLPRRASGFGSRWSRDRGALQPCRASTAVAPTHLTACPCSRGGSYPLAATLWSPRR